MSDGVGAGVERGVSENDEEGYRDGGTDWRLARIESPLDCPEEILVAWLDGGSTSEGITLFGWTAWNRSLKSCASNKGERIPSASSSGTGEKLCRIWHAPLVEPNLTRTVFVGRGADTEGMISTVSDSLCRLNIGV